MARTQSVGNFARVPEKEGGPSSPGGGSSSVRGDEDGPSSPGEPGVEQSYSNNVIPRNASAGSFLDADSSVRPAIWDVFGDDATLATTTNGVGRANGSHGGAHANGGGASGGGTAERKSSRKAAKSREAYVDGAAAVEAAASTPRRHKSGKPPRWVN